MLAPKGIVDKSTWQNISRCVDKVDKIYKNTSKVLNLQDEAEPRIVFLSDEILEWRAVLRYSSLLENTDTDNIYNIYGEVLNGELSNLSTLLKEKRLQYWKTHLDGTSLENIRLDRVSILNGCDLDSEED